MLYTRAIAPIRLYLTPHCRFRYPFPALKTAIHPPKHCLHCSSFTSDILSPWYICDHGFWKTTPCCNGCSTLPSQNSAGKWKLTVCSVISLDKQRPLSASERDKARTLRSAPNHEVGAVHEARAVSFLASSPRYSRNTFPVETNHCNNFLTSPANQYVAETTRPSQRTAHFTDVYEHADNTITTRTVIRPMSPYPGVSCFPKTNKYQLGYRRRSPISKLLNCCKADAFEEVVDFSLQELEKRSAGSDTKIQVRIYKEKSVFKEERWRDSIRAMLYGRAPRVESVVGHIEVC